MSILSKPLMGIELLTPDAIVPTYANVGDCGLDLYSIEHVGFLPLFPLFPNTPILHGIKPNHIQKVRIGISISLPIGKFGMIKDRSSMASRGIHVLGGIIDEGYRGEIVVVLCNLTSSIQEVRKGERIAQLIILPFYRVEWEVVEEGEKLSKSDRGGGGFGSSGK